MVEETRLPPSGALSQVRQPPRNSVLWSKPGLAPRGEGKGMQFLRQYSSRPRPQTLGLIQSEFEPQLGHLLDVCPWASHLFSLNLIVSTIK